MTVGGRGKQRERTIYKLRRVTALRFPKEQWGRRSAAGPLWKGLVRGPTGAVQSRGGQVQPHERAPRWAYAAPSRRPPSSRLRRRHPPSAQGFAGWTLPVRPFEGGGGVLLPQLTGAPARPPQRPRPGPRPALGGALHLRPSEGSTWNSRSGDVVPAWRKGAANGREGGAGRERGACVGSKVTPGMVAALPRARLHLLVTRSPREGRCGGRSPEGAYPGGGGAPSPAEAGAGCVAGGVGPPSSLRRGFPPRDLPGGEPRGGRRPVRGQRGASCRGLRAEPAADRGLLQRAPLEAGEKGGSRTRRSAPLLAGVGHSARPAEGP